MRKWIIPFTFFLLTLPASAPAQEEVGALSLEQSIQIALGQSPSIAAARDKLTGADYKRKAALADFFPKVKGEFQYLMLDQTSSFDMGGGSGDDLPNITLYPIDEPEFPQGLYNLLVGDGMDVPIDMSVLFGEVDDRQGLPVPGRPLDRDQGPLRAGRARGDALSPRDVLTLR